MKASCLGSDYMVELSDNAVPMKTKFGEWINCYCPACDKHHMFMVVQ